MINFQDWNLFDDSAAWREATLGTVEEKKAKLAKPEFRQAVRAEYDAGTPTRDFIFGELHKYVAQKIVRPDLREKYLGLTVEEIAKRENKHVIDAMLDLTLADDLQTEWLGSIVNNNVQYHKEMLSSPAAIPGVSDGGAHIKFLALGVYPTGEWRRVQRVEGYKYIMVNGGVTFEDGKCTGATPGKLLRHGRAV